MLSLQSVSTGGAGYYSGGAYYLGEAQEKIVQESEWCGKGAAALQLKGGVGADAFTKILDGTLPNGQTLGRIEDGKRVHAPGTDLTFSAPKSVSIAAEVLKDQRLVQAHKEAVRDALGFVQDKFLETRIYDPATRSQKTVGNQKMVAALFKQDTSRQNDPNMHTHAVVANIAIDQAGTARSVHNGALFRNKMTVGAFYRASLAQKATALGYEVERTSKDGQFELKHMPANLIKTFSKRAESIKADLAGKDNPTPVDKAHSAVTTRPTKSEPPRAALEADWNAQMSALGYSPDELLKNLTREHTAPAFSAQTIVSDAIEAITKQTAVFKEKDITQRVLQNSVGRLAPQQALDALARAEAKGEILRDRATNLLTTPRSIRLEKATLEHEQAGRLDVDPLLSPFEPAPALNTVSLKDEQMAALTGVLGSVNRFVGLDGKSGTGKTTMLRGLHEVAQSKGLSVLGLAPTSTARNELTKAGIEAMTLQKFILKNEDAPPNLDKTMLVVDEASMISTRAMETFLSIANEGNAARAFLIGDTKQLQPIQAGAPFLALIKNDMQTHKMVDIMRQSNEQERAAVLDLSEGKISEAFEKLAGNIQEAPRVDLAAYAALTWLDKNKAHPGDVVAMAQTHAMCSSIAQHIREGLQATGQLGATEQHFNTLAPTLREASDRRDVANYQPGQMILFRGKQSQLENAPNSYWQVDGKDGNSLSISNGREHTQWTPDRTNVENMEVFENRSLPLSEGDRVRFTRNHVDRKSHLNNDVVTLTSLTDTHIHFQHPDTGHPHSLDMRQAENQHMAQGWVLTVHAMQGQTHPHAVYTVDSALSELTTQTSAYVGLSRHQESVEMITDSRDALISQLEDATGEKLNALDLEVSNERDSDKDHPDDSVGSPEASLELNPAQDETEPQAFADLDLENMTDAEQIAAIIEFSEREQIKDDPIIQEFLSKDVDLDLPTPDRGDIGFDI